MPTTALDLQPHVLFDVRNADFSAWVLGGLWGLSPFDSLPRGVSGLWHHTPGTGRYPNHTGYDYTGATTQDAAEAPTVDLSLFVNPDGSGDNNEQFWTVYVRVWYRPNHNKASLGGVDQQHDRLWLLANIGGDDFEIAEFDNFDIVSDNGGKTELSRIDPVIGVARASEVLTLTTQPAAGETVTIAKDQIFDKVYTFEGLPGSADGQVAIGADLDESVANLAAAINLEAGGAGIKYGTGTVIHPSVTAVASTDTLTATHTKGGLSPGQGNLLAVSETLANGSWGSGFLNGGSNGSIDPNAGDDGKWWHEQIIAPTLEQQALLLGSMVDWKLSLEIAERDASDYGVGIARFSVEVIRGDVQSNALARGGFGGIPPVQPNFPASLYKSWANSSRWR